MTDQLISFETAKLAKEKGFISRSPYYQIDDADEIDLVDMKGFPLHSNNEEGEYWEAPTQSLLQKWLREVHNIHIISKPFYDSKTKKTTYVADCIRIVNDGRTSKSHICDTYELALEEGLVNALKLIDEEPIITLISDEDE